MTTTFGPNAIMVYPSSRTSMDTGFMSSPLRVSATRLSYGAVFPRSYRADGVNAIFMDGAVQFITDGIDLTTWRALGTRAGAETNSADF